MAEEGRGRVEADEVEAEVERTRIEVDETEEVARHEDTETERHRGPSDPEEAEAWSSDEADDQADATDDPGPTTRPTTRRDELAPVLATLPLNPTAAFDAHEAAELANGNGNGTGNGLAARLHSLASAARNVSEHQEVPDDLDDVGTEDVLRPPAPAAGR